MSNCTATVTGLFASAGLFFAAAAPVHAVTTWNWSFTTYTPNTFGSGTFTTADVTPTANVDVQVTGIAGSITVQGSTYSITALTGSLDNIFQWDGTGSSPLLVRDSIGKGISFNTSNGSYSLVYLDNNDGSIRPVVALDAPSTAFGINASSVQPVATPSGAAAAPGPLPLFGAAAAFGASRRLRHRIKIHKISPLG